MPTNERDRPPAQEPEQPRFVPPPPDVRLSWEDREDFLTAVARVAPNESSALAVLRRLGFPGGRLPSWAGMRPEDWWAQIFADFEHGIMAEPFRRLIGDLVRRYQANAVFVRLAQRYLTPEPTPEVAQSTCHVIIRASTEGERAAAAASLREVQLDAHEVWSTEHAVSFAVGSTDVALVRNALTRTSLGWTVVPPGQPDYLLRELFVQGPDGSRYLLVDAPAQQTFRNVATEVVEQYGQEFSEASRPTVIDRVHEEGGRERVNPDDTLHDAGVQDGDQLRVGFEAGAGAVNPIDHQNALDRVLDEIRDFAKQRADVAVRANSSTLPTEYEIDFEQRSFGPPATEGGEPTLVDRHTLLVQLGPEFPQTALDVFWLTPIFHPNVFPNYDCEQSRRDPHLAGLVCLGVLAESWHPGQDFGFVCQMCVEIAGYRNYNLFEPTGELDAGEPRLRANFFDQTAARWAYTHQREITAIGGRPILPSTDPEPKGRRNVIHRTG